MTKIILLKAGLFSQKSNTARTGIATFMASIMLMFLQHTLMLMYAQALCCCMSKFIADFVYVSSRLSAQLTSKEICAKHDSFKRVRMLSHRQLRCFRSEILNFVRIFFNHSITCLSISPPDMFCLVPSKRRNTGIDVNNMKNACESFQLDYRLYYEQYHLLT